jgi:hypothetical protein
LEELKTTQEFFAKGCHKQGKNYEYQQLAALKGVTGLSQGVTNFVNPNRS